MVRAMLPCGVSSVTLRISTSEAGTVSRVHVGTCVINLSEFMILEEASPEVFQLCSYLQADEFRVCGRRVRSLGCSLLEHNRSGFQMLPLSPCFQGYCILLYLTYFLLNLIGSSGI